ncbi:PAS domain S-box protein [Halorubrum sp. N11]|uniref:PAS domain S-box protein n=1 Tax=Halorubrum sp. N11 TaxID=3402276 RepID=UPI003EBDDBA5
MSTETETHSVDGRSSERVLERIDEAVYAVDDDWQFTFVNDRAAAMLEREPDELLGNEVWEAVPRIDEGVVGERLREAMATQRPVRFEYRDEALDRPLTVRLHPAEDGVTACFCDVSAEQGETLDSNRQRRLFETVFDETGDALVVLDSDGRITDFNGAAERLFGYDADEVIGEEPRLLYATTDHQGTDRRLTEGREPGETHIVRYERADGTTFEGETHGTPLNGSDTRADAFLVSVRDMSARAGFDRGVEAHNDALQAFHEIATDDDRPIDERIDSVLKLGNDHLGLDVGILSKIGDEYTVERAVAPTGTIESGDRFDLGETFCELVVDADEVVTMTHASESGMASHPAYQTHAIEAYIGAPVVVDGERYGTINFSRSTPRQRPFSAGNRTFVRVLAQWVGKELSRRRYKREATANRDRLRQIIDLLPQFVFAKDRDNEYILANQAIADAYGATVEEVEGSTDADYVTSEAEAEQFREDDLAVIDSAEPKQIPEERLTTASGETLTVRTTKIPYDPIGHEKEAVLGVATDITEAKRRERELEETTQRLNVALKGTNAGVWELDLETRAVIWTKSIMRLFGLDPDTTEGTYEEFIELVHPEDVPDVRKSLEGPTEDGDTLQVEYRIEQDDGDYMWVEARAELLVSENTGRRLVGIATDITERKERDAEIELQSAAMEVAMDGIAILDDDEYVYMNQAHADIFGYEPEELIGREWRAVYADDEIERVESEVFPELAETGAWSGETLGRKRDGTPVYQDLGLSLLESGELICTNRDVTDRKEREQRLQRQQSRLRALFDNSPDGIIVHDAEGSILDANDTQLEVLGLEREDLESMNVVDFEVGPERGDLESVWSEMTDYEVLKVEGEHRRQNGETFPVEVWVNKVAVDGSDQYIAVSRDITEQKRLERSLRESERSLRELTGIASDTDRDFEDKLTALLELGTERLGLPYGFLNRIEGGRQHTVRAVGDHPELQTGASAPQSETYCRETVQQAGPLTIQNAVDEGWDGDSAYERFDLACYIGATVTVDGETYGTLCFADDDGRDHEFDDTERAFVELLVQWISHELATASFESQLRDLNETAQRLMSAPSKSQVASITIESVSSILGIPITGVWWYDEKRDALVPECTTPEAGEYIDEQPVFESGEALAWDAFTTGQMQVHDDLTDVDGLHNDETVLRSEVIVPLGEHGIVSVGSIDQRAFTETDLNLLEVLSSTVEAALVRAEREAVLRETQAELKQSNEELEQFAYAASHDLQEPLRTVSSYLTLLERRYGDELDDDAGEFIEFAVNGADRMREMIQALLAYSRVDTRGESFKPVGISELFDRVVEGLKVKITETDATVSAPTTEATVVGDQAQLAQLFQNLIDNGIKYNKGEPVVDISVAHREESVVFEVTDNGIGMEPDQTEDIFEVFHRLHTREEFTGTGIGLSICRKIVDRHGGEISVDSEPSEGSTFIITLPKGETTDV